MGLNELVDYSIKKVIIFLRQDDECHLPDYGPVVRGWLGCAISKNPDLFRDMFKNPNLDVRPYQMFTEVRDRHDVLVHISFLGRHEEEIEQIIRSLDGMRSSHLAGRRIDIRRVRYSEERFKPVRPGTSIRFDFRTPSKITMNKTSSMLPSYQSIIRSLVRSVNRFSKYNLPDVYPIQLPNEIRDTRARVTGFDLRPVTLRHLRMTSDILSLDGVRGHIDFETDHVDAYVSDLYSLSQFFQIGKWVNYGFGKIEVST